MATIFSLLVLLSAVVAQVQEYGQCGGINYSGSTTCVSPFVCTVINPYYSQCLPGTGNPTTTPTPTTTPISPPPTSPPGGGSATPSNGIPKLVGVNLSGWDWGTQTDGSLTSEASVSPFSNNQITHFTNEGVNIFRIPIGWQALTASSLSGSFNQTAWSLYQASVNQALSAGAYVIIDIHNYARWNGAVIGQGGPTNDQFAATWGTIAKAYASNPKVIFGIMNEPHDLTLSTWGTTVQVAVNAIRSAGATKNPILIPGDNWTSASTFTSWYTTMSKVTDPITANGNSLLIFDHHRYLDADGSGTHNTCVDSRISEFQANVAFLKSVGRQAIVSEIGSGNDASCLTSPGYLPQAIQYITSSYPWYIGVTGWGAGSFTPNTQLSLSPNPNNAVSATDTSIWAAGFKPFLV